jgi:putative transposase
MWLVRDWALRFARWYNTEHRHSGLKFLTPNQRHQGPSEQIFKNRQLVYEAAKVKHAERWSGNIRDWSLDDQVWLNPEKVEVIKAAQNRGIYRE